MSLFTRNDPITDFEAVIRNAFGPVTPATYSPASEIVRDGDDVVVRVELPGLDPTNDVTVELDRGRLVVSGERRDERAESTAGRPFSEVRYGSFRRAFKMPSHVTADAVSASYDAGVLSVRVVGAYAGTSAQRISVTSGAAPTEKRTVDSVDEPTP
ncbi:MAG: Hsp20/alpha crystallin family protein [Jatrophihabitantaceae bacterium]